jgi:hypothetical protein
MWLRVKARSSQSFHATVCAALPGGRRLSSTSDEIPEEFLHKHLAPSPNKKISSPFIITTRREVLSLYREIWRATRVFTWPNEQGAPWRDVLRLSARREFEAARVEKDPETIARLVVVGRDAVRGALEKFVDKRDQLVADPKPESVRRP